MKHGLGKIMGVVCIMLFVLPHLVKAMEVKYTAQFSEADLSFRTLMGYDVVEIKDGNIINDIGKPMIPAKEIKVALPKDFAVKSVKVVATKSMEIKGEYNIFPAQPPIRISGKPGEFVQPDLDVYNSTAPYPGDLVKFIDMTDLAGQSMAVIQLYPIQYIPGEKKLTLYTMISVVIEGMGGYKYGDYLNSEKNRGKYEQIVKDMVVNPEDVMLNTAPHGSPAIRTLSGGPYDHVIISKYQDTTYWKPLAEWHKKRGLRDTVITTSWIYANYSGSDNQQRIRNFIIDANKSQAQGGWETDYVLLCGENTDVPFKYVTYVSDNIPSDEYYGDYDDDWTYEVYVGRVTASGSPEINRFVTKLLKYEKNPPLTNYILNITLLGMDLTIPPDPVTYGEQLKEIIDGYIDDTGDPPYVITKVYDSDGDYHTTKFLDALNAGQNLVNHCDHGDWNVMCTGDRRHGWYIGNGNVDALTNTNRMSVVFSLGCHCNEMDASDCIGEHFVIYNDLKAGVAYTGNTRSGWFYVGVPNSLSGTLDNYWWRAIFNYNKYRLGEALAKAKYDFSHSDDYEKYCHWTLNLLGEPEMPIWTNTPDNFNVSHPATLPTGPSSFTVHVTNSTGSPQNLAYVCLWKGTEVYLTGSTNSAGNAIFTPSPSTGGTMYVTVTKQNFLPDTGYATVTVNTPPNIPSSPSPIIHATGVSINADLNWTGGDPDIGDVVVYDVYFEANDATPDVRVSDDQSGTTFDPGTMSYSTHYYWQIISKDNHGAETSGPIWDFTTEAPQYTLTIIINPTDKGTVTKNPDWSTYPAGTPVELTANGNIPWQFDHWTGGLTGSENPKTIIMDGDKTVTAHFVIPGHVLNLNDFPMYLAADGVHSGAAVAQMALNYMWWDGVGSPPMTYPQSQVYDTTQVYSAADPFADVNGVWKALQILRPLPYDTFGYNFNKYSNTDSSIMLKLICEWIDYTIGTYGGYKPGYPLHVPAIIPAYGNYTNWMAVRGIHTDVVSYPIPPALTIYGFWVNDPLPGGIGENSYKTVQEFAATYYKVDTVVGDPYNGKYVGIFEPPESAENCELTLAQSVPRFTEEQTQVLGGIEPGVIIKPIEDWIIKAAIDGVTEELIPYDENFAALFGRTVPGKPFFVEGVSNEDYYAVPFKSAVQLDGRPQKKNVLDHSLEIIKDKAMVVVLIDAHDGSFKEVSWTNTPVEYLPLTKEEAQQIAFDKAQELGLEVGDVNDLQPELIYRKSSPYYPEWRVVIEEYVIYIAQDGSVEIEANSGSGPGGGTMGDDKIGSFVYALNTAMPTPFSRNTMISYSIAHLGHVSLNVYDISGRLVKIMVNERRAAGVYSVNWNAYDDNNKHVAPGVYFVKLASGDFVSVKKLILVK